MKFLQLSLVLLSLLLLSACSDDENRNSTNQESSQKQNAADRKQAVKMTISGDENFEFNYNAVFACTQESMGVSMMAHSPTMQLSLPRNTVEGSYQLADWNPNISKPTQAMLNIVGEINDERRQAGKTRGKVYTVINSGSLTIKKVPRKAGDHFLASLEADMASKQGGNISAKLDFNIANPYICSN